MKQEQNHMSDDLLVKCMLGEANASEMAELNTWLTRDEANRKYFEHFSLIWNTSKKLELKSAVSENAAWERFKQKAQAQQVPERRTIPFTPPMNWVRAAAILLVIIGAGWSVFYFGGKMGTEMAFIHATDKVLNYTLADGTSVTLNKDATLYYPEKFEGKTRKVKLEGEAFFNVIPDKEKPFIIDVNDVSVQVVGTSFNIKSSAEDVEVIVETGVVEVAKKRNTVILNPDEKVTVHKNSDRLEKQQVTDELYNYYRTREFICNGTPLWRLVDVLNEAYNARITIENSRIKDLPLTTTFHNATLDEVLIIVSETLDIKVEKKGEQIILK